MRRDHEPSIGAMLRFPLAGCILVLALTSCGVGHSSTPATAVATETEPRSAIPTPTTGTESITVAAARDRKWLLAASYTPDRYEVSQILGGTRILVFHSVCTGSADGHCQAIQVFRAVDSKPVWVGHYAGVKSFRATAGGFSVTSVQYASSDPLCCPSLPPETRDYQWNGKTFAASRPGSRVSP